MIELLWKYNESLMIAYSFRYIYFREENDKSYETCSNAQGKKGNWLHAEKYMGKKIAKVELFIKCRQKNKCFPISNQRAANGERLQHEKKNLQTHFYFALLQDRN